MSLINEALKKAQQSAPSPQHPVMASPSPAQVEPAPAASPPRKSFIWGFIAALLLVGIVTTLMTAFIVSQFLGDSDKESSVKSEDSNPTTLAAEGLAPGSQPLVEQPLIGNSRTDMDEAGNAGTASATAPVLAKTVQSEPEEVPTEPQPMQEVYSRLNEFQIRGVMSGGTKVLIYDRGSETTRAYVPQDTLPGPYPVTLIRINSNSITFADHAGAQYTKSF
jgi:hypothetical protein